MRAGAGEGAGQRSWLRAELGVQQGAGPQDPKVETWAGGRPLSDIATQVPSTLQF